MTFEVYYFSGTGNSLAVARDIAQRIEGTLIPIPAVLAKKAIKTADSIGIVFPSYMAQLHGVPLIIERFVKKLENINSKYIFAVCTCGGYESVNALPTLKTLSKIIKTKGVKLRAGYSVRLPMNNLSYDHIPIPIDKNNENIIKRSKKKIKAICQRIIERKKTKFKIIKSLFNVLMTPMYLLLRNVYISALKRDSKEPKHTKLKYYELMPLTDRSILVTDTCNGCGSCVKICPVQNIKMVDKRPVFQHGCEICFACDEWCPKGAIQHWGRAEGIKYHHPEVKIADMFI